MSVWGEGVSHTQTRSTGIFADIFMNNPTDLGGKSSEVLVLLPIPLFDSTFGQGCSGPFKKNVGCFKKLQMP